MVKTLQMSGLPGSFRVTRAGSVAAGLSFSQMVSGESKRAIVLPRLFDILAWPSSPRTRFAVESRACGSGSENPFANRVFQWRDGVQDPVELRVLGDVRLHEDDGPRRIDAGGEEPDRHVDRALGQGRCVVGLRDGMQVHDAEQAVVLVLQLDPVLYGAEVIADVQLARRLDAGEDARHGLTTYDGGGQRRKVRELKDLVDVAKHAAERAARFLRSTTPASSPDWIEKGRHDFVTEADRQAEALIADTLLHAVPESRVVGDELSPAVAREGDVVWSGGRI